MRGTIKLSNALHLQKYELKCSSLIKNYFLNKYILETDTTSGVAIN